MALLNKRLDALLFAVALCFSQPAAAVSLEYLVKANFLLKFVPFVRWPNGGLPDGAPFVLCVAANDPFDGALQTLIVGKRIEGHPVVVVNGTTGCNMMFVRAPSSMAAKLLADVDGQPILTVVDDDSGDGGIIGFRFHNGRVRFVVNEGLASRARLEVSSRLLNSALNVERGSAR